MRAGPTLLAVLGRKISTCATPGAAENLSPAQPPQRPTIRRPQTVQRGLANATLQTMKQCNLEGETRRRVGEGCEVMGCVADLARTRRDFCMGSCAAPSSEELCGAFNAYIDFAAEGPEVDWFSQQRLSTLLQSLPLRLRVAIGGNHDNRDVRS